MSTSLATCMITVMGIQARKMGFDLEGVRIDVFKKMASNPRRVSGIDLNFHVPRALENIEPQKLEILKKTGINCPVQLSINPEIEVKIDWGSWK